jgi:16S rRNA (adenine1518-N6/adenine1519-N6)-dimethyltransferase
MPRPISRATRTQLEARPRRSLGQNFLRDRALARWLADSLPVGPDDTIVEIGPGSGAVTEHLAGRGRRLILIEKDRALAAHQRDVFRGDERVEVIEADAARLDPARFFRHGPLKVLGNLPYSVGTTIMTRWLESPSPVGEALFMLQREVCDRVVAAPRSPDYGQLTVKIQARWLASIVQHVGPSAFHPPPKVDSAVLSLHPRPRHAFPVFSESLLDRLVKLGFSQRRKQLKNLLATETIAWESIAPALGLPLAARAEELTVPQWIELARRHHAHPPGDAAQSDDELFDVVDDHDRVTGQATRAEVHARGLKHRAIHLFAFRKNGDLLLQKRSHLKDTCPGLWDSSAAGHLNAGEPYHACAIREMSEELGLDTGPQPPEPLARIPACKETGWEFVHLFRVLATGTVRFPPAEIECVHAFPPAEIDAWTRARPQDFAPGFLRCWSAFRQPA